MCASALVGSPRLLLVVPCCFPPQQRLAVAERTVAQLNPRVQTLQSELDGRRVELDGLNAKLVHSESMAAARLEVRVPA